MFARSVLFLAACAALAQQWTPELSMKVANLGAVTTSNGWVAWTESRWVYDREKSEQDTQVIVARADGSARRSLGKGSAPAISGDHVYFRQNGVILRAPLAGGDSQRVLEWRGAMGTFAVSPSGKWIAFTGREPDSEREAARKEKRDWRMLSSTPPNHEVWISGAQPGAVPRKLWSGDRHASGIEWSPDEKKIAAELRVSPFADDSATSDVFEIAMENGAARKIAATNASERQPRYSPDGKHLALVVSADPPQSAGDDRIVVVSEGGVTRSLAPSPDRLPQILGWTADSSRILFLEQRGTRDVVFAMPLQGVPEAIFAPVGAMSIEEAGQAALAYVLETSDQAPEVFVKSLKGGDPVRVSAANVDLPKVPLGKTETVRWKSKDGTQIEGLLTFPVGYQKGKRYPLVLNIHGGPYGGFSETFIGKSGLYPIATFASKGYVVLRPNPRSSTGYGRDFRFALLKDWGGVDFDDIQSGVDFLIAEKIVDPERMAIMGWSYGGYMTNWTITQTSRFKAAAAGAGMSNLTSQTGTADIRSNKVAAFGAPWENVAYYTQRSPITHIGKVKTPLLILHGEADERVPVSQGYEMYWAVKRIGVPAEMVVYPRTPHGPREPKFVLDIMQRHIDWVEKYVR